MAKGKTKFPVSDELRNTVISKPTIETIHFTATGKHYFNVFTHGGRKYGQVTVTKILKDGKPIETKTPILSTLIVESVDRDTIVKGVGEVVEAE